MTTQIMFESKPSSAVESLAVDFRKLWAHDPVMKELFDGTISWGDIFYSPEEEERCRIHRERCAAELAAERAAYVQLHQQRPIRVTFANDEPQMNHCSEKQTLVLDRVVPEFIPGIRTLMAKNLPRDINVQELRAIFEKHGAIRDIYIPKNMDKSSPYFGTIKGFAKIQFLKAEDSATAFTAQWDLLHIRGKHIVLEFAKEDR